MNIQIGTGLCQFLFLALVLHPQIAVAQNSPHTVSREQPESPLVASFKKFQQLRERSLLGLEWVPIGPVVNSARVESVQLDPTRPGTIYAAFGSGNLWKSQNNGTTWRPIFENQPSHGIGDIALAPSDPNIIYLGTGESLKKARNFTIPGNGIYRSNDGGESWTHLGLSDSWHIGEISVHPTDPNIVLVAVLGHFWSPNKNRGVYRTEDGGKSWEHVLKIDDKTGANDVVFAPSNPDIAYASMWENYPDVAGKNSGIYKTTDGGATWERCSDGLPVSDQLGRIGLAVSYTNPDKVYALIDNRSRIQEGAAQVFQTLDGGKSWSRTHESDLKFLSRIGWYFADIYVSPQNDDEVFALGVRLAHSVDGGKTFKFVGGVVNHVTPSAASGLHLDQCELWINPENPNHVVVGNDGGLYQSFDRGHSWRHFNNIPAGEFYDIAVDDSQPYRIFAGAQDNATVYGPPNDLTIRFNQPWKYLWIDPWNGGDGCITLIDPSDPNRVYHSAQEGAFRRKNMATNRSVFIKPRLSDLPGNENASEKDEVRNSLAFNFVAPMILSPHDPKTLFLGGNYLFKSSNRGDDWECISPDFSASENSKRSSVAASAIAESPIQPGLLFVGSEKGEIWVSEDGGGNWQNRTGNLPIGYVRNIAMSRHSDSRAYLASSGLNYDDLNSYLFVTEDNGVTWNSISANLPSEPANVVIEDPVYENILFAGTFRGVFVSLDRGKSWSLLGKNLPVCSVADQEIQTKAKDLIVGTHGRGIYRVGLEPLYRLHEENLSAGKNDLLFPIPTFRRPYLSDIRPGLNFRVPEKTPITFWSTESGEVTLTVLRSSPGHDGPSEQPPNRQPKTADPDIVASFNIDAKRGLNQFRWDLQISQQESPEPYFINYRSYLAAGRYRMELKRDGKVISTGELKVKDATQAN